MLFFCSTASTSQLDLNQANPPLIMSLSSAYHAVFIHLYQWDAAERHEASRFEEVVEDEESKSKEEESDLEEEESCQ
ncbi:hypothetical protein CPC08DRAFT_401442 [Agrocybe pediades]|nr:hypothetical protein CPC08DRAFT_401442 [Agrocybe pediades]